jgi:hypothetical protein
MDSTIEKGHGVQPVTSLKSTSPHVTGKSSLTAAQYHRIIARLKLGTATTYDLNALGITNCAARISEINKMEGWFIATVDQRPARDAFGYLHQKVAHYSLVNEPGDHGKRSQS